MEVEIGDQGGDRCGWGGHRWSEWTSIIHGSWIMSLVGDEDGWVWLERLGFSGFQWRWAVVMEIDDDIIVGR